MSVIDILRNSSDGKLEKLPKSICADYIWTPTNVDQTKGIPFKYQKETDGKSWGFYIKKYVYILEFLDNKILILSPEEIPYSGISSSSLINKFKSRITENNIIDELQKYVNEYIKDIIDIKKDTTRKQWSRDDNIKSSNNNSNLEAQAHKEFMNILSNNMKKTVDCCLSDWCYYKDNLSKSLAIQTKTATISDLNDYKFSKTKKYSGLLLACRPMPKQDVGTLIIPGELIKIEYLHVTLKENTKYWPYFVSDNNLKKFMSDLYDADA